MCEKTTIEVKQDTLSKPSTLARYAVAGGCCAIFSVWWKCAIVPEGQVPGIDVPMHSYHTPLMLTVGYLLSLPLLKTFVDKFLKGVDMKELLKESMVLYNVAQVGLNGWMVYSYINAVMNKGHPFIGSIYSDLTVFASWVHYCDKYLEFFDTYFMILRGKMNQVSFLHVYHHFSIAWAWWAGLGAMPGGDSYFGALLNSWIHVMMYSYYLLALLKVPCPWKRFLTQAQLVQFTSVILYSLVCINTWKKEEKEGQHVMCIVVQIWEMSSLFILFSMFYAKSYNKKNKKAKKDASEEKIDDQCQKAFNDAVEGAAQIVESVTKDASKVVESIPSNGKSTKLM